MNEDKGRAERGVREADEVEQTGRPIVSLDELEDLEPREREADQVKGGAPRNAASRPGSIPVT